MHAFHVVVYPLMLEKGLVWCAVGAVGILSDEIAKDPKLQACVIEEPSEVELTATSEKKTLLQPETVKVPLIKA